MSRYFNIFFFWRSFTFSVLGFRKGAKIDSFLKLQGEASALIEELPWVGFPQVVVPLLCLEAREVLF